jgi:hypothetical protein
MMPPGQIDCFDMTVHRSSSITGRTITSKRSLI